MPRVDVPVTRLNYTAGVWASPVTGDPTNNHIMANNGRTFLHVKNNDTINAHNVTFVTPKQVGGLAVADVTVSVAASSDVLTGPFPTDLFNQSGADAGKVHIDVDSNQLELRAYSL